MVALASLAIGVAWGASTGVGASHPQSPGATVFWAADRGADRLMGLDRDLFFTESISLRAPTRLAPARAGGVFVVNACQGRPAGAHALRLVRPGAELLWERRLGPVLDLESDGVGAVLVELEEPGAQWARVLAVSSAGAMSLVGQGDILCAARSAERFLVGFESGLVQLLGGDRRSPCGEWDAGGAVTDVAPAGDAGWWVLSRRPQGGTRLSALDRGLGLRWSRVTLSGALTLVPGRGGTVWCAAAGRSPVSRYGSTGALELRVDTILAPLGRGVALADGGLVWIAPGALMRLDRDGLVAPGQGGFSFLVDVVRASSDP